MTKQNSKTSVVNIKEITNACKKFDEVHNNYNSLLMLVFLRQM